MPAKSSLEAETKRLHHHLTSSLGAIDLIAAAASSSPSTDAAVLADLVRNVLGTARPHGDRATARTDSASAPAGSPAVRGPFAAASPAAGPGSAPGSAFVGAAGTPAAAAGGGGGGGGPGSSSSVVPLALTPTVMAVLEMYSHPTPTPSGTGGGGGTAAQTAAQQAKAGAAAVASAETVAAEAGTLTATATVDPSVFFRVSFAHAPERTFIVTPHCPIPTPPHHAAGAGAAAAVAYGRDVLETSPDALSLLFRLRVPTLRRAEPLRLLAALALGDVVVRVAGRDADAAGAAGRAGAALLLDVELLHCADVFVDPRCWDALFSLLVPAAAAMTVTEANTRFSPSLHPEAPHVAAALAAAAAGARGGAGATAWAGGMAARAAVSAALAAPAATALLGLAALPPGVPGAAAPAAMGAVATLACPEPAAGESGLATGEGAPGAALPGAASGLGDGFYDWAVVAASPLGVELPEHEAAAAAAVDADGTVYGAAVQSGAVAVGTLASGDNGLPADGGAVALPLATVSAGAGAGAGAGPVRVTRVSPGGFAFGAWGLGQHYSPAHTALQYVQLMLHL